jgi:Glycosyltransferase family 87
MAVMWVAFRRLATPVVFGVLPVAVVIVWVVESVHQGNLGLDFRGELYPEAKLVLHGHNPFPRPGADLSGGVNRIFPIPSAILATPLTILSAHAAAAVFVALLGIAVAATLRVMGVTDWRVYGLVALWPPTISALQAGNVTVLLALLGAVAWRYRDRRYVPGIAVGAAVALKLILWPLLFWLAAQGSYRAAALGAVLSAASFLLVLPFTSLSAYVHLLDHLGDTFAPHSYNVAGLLVQSGAAGLSTAKLAGYAVGALVLAAACVRRSFPLAVTASIVLSPIVWLHYFELLVLPLAARWPRLAPAWFLPLVLLVVPGTSGEVRERHIVVGLAVLAAVSLLVEPRPELDRTSRLLRGPA